MSLRESTCKHCAKTIHLGEYEWVSKRGYVSIDCLEYNHSEGRSLTLRQHEPVDPLVALAKEASK